MNAIDSDDEEENAKQEKKMKYKKLDMKKVNGVEDDPECGQMDEEGNMITGFNLKVYYVILTHNSKKVGRNGRRRVRFNGSISLQENKT